MSNVTQHIDSNSHKLVKQVAHTLVCTWSLQAALNKSLHLWLHSVTNFFRSPCWGQPSIRSSSFSINSPFKGKPCGTPNKDCHSTWLNGPSGEAGEISMGRHSKQYSHFRVSCNTRKLHIVMSYLINAFKCLSFTWILMAYGKWEIHHYYYYNYVRDCSVQCANGTRNLK